MTKLYQLLISNIIKPLLIEGALFLFNWIKKSISEYFRKRKLKNENKKKIENYKKADGVDAAIDDFSELP